MEMATATYMGGGVLIPMPPMFVGRWTPIRHIRVYYLSVSRVHPCRGIRIRRLRHVRVSLVPCDRPHMGIRLIRLG